MPTIKRPETDNQLLQALEAAKLKADVTPPATLAFSPAVLTALLAFLPNFRQQMQQRGVALSVQSSSTTLADAAKARLKIFISHFFQVFNLGVERGLFSADHRPHYLLDVNQEDLPQLDTEQQIQMWAQRIADGETSRTAAGGAPMGTPSAGEVQAEAVIYVAQQGDQSVKKDAYDNEQEDVQDLRTEATDIAADIWDEVEFTFRKESAASKRRKAREYGVVYEPRTGETPSPEEYSITGKCTEPPTPSTTGAIVSDVEVKVVQTGAIVLSNSTGDYFVPTQPAGTYTLEARKPGFNLQVISGVVVTDGVMTALNIVLTRSTAPTPAPPGPATPA